MMMAVNLDKYQTPSTNILLVSVDTPTRNNFFFKHKLQLS